MPDPAPAAGPDPGGSGGSRPRDQDRQFTRDPLEPVDLTGDQAGQQAMDDVGRDRHREPRGGGAEGPVDPAGQGRLVGLDPVEGGEGQDQSGDGTEQTEQGRDLGDDRKHPQAPLEPPGFLLGRSEGSDAHRLGAARQEPCGPPYNPANGIAIVDRDHRCGQPPLGQGLLEPGPGVALAPFEGQQAPGPFEGHSEADDRGQADRDQHRATVGDDHPQHDREDWHTAGRASSYRRVTPAADFPWQHGAPRRVQRMDQESPEQRLILEGMAGWVRGERFILADGVTTIGRSRSCDISMRRIPGYLNQPADERDKDHDFNTVSRTHVRLSVEGTAVRVEDLSTNGAFIDEEPIEDARSVEIADQPILLRLGTRETFRLATSAQTEAAGGTATAGDELIGRSTEQTNAGGELPSDGNDDESLDLDEPGDDTQPARI